MNKKEILGHALVARDEEILGYQINIDNYTLAIAHIEESGDIELEEFKSRLMDLLKSEKLEQKKAKVMRDVISKQLEQ